MTEILMVRTAMFLALGAFFIALFFFAEGTRRPFQPGLCHPFSRPGRLVLLLSAFVVLCHCIESVLPRCIA